MSPLDLLKQRIADLSMLWHEKTAADRKENQMTRLTNTQTTTWFTTPAELRELAAQMEAKIATVRPGDSVVVTKFYGPSCILEVAIDQDRVEG